MNDIETAIHWWLSENCRNNASAFPGLRSLCEHLFYCANSLYPIVEQDPVPTEIPKGITIDSSATNSCYFLNKPKTEDFFKIRGILSLVGDMILLINEIRKMSEQLDNNSLSSIIDRHQLSFKALHAARHYFTHFNERIGKEINQHGVSGELKIRELGLVFRKESRGNFYLGFKDGVIYFHDKQKGEKKPLPKAISYTRKGLLPLFSLVIEMYELFTSHKIHPTVYPESKDIYELFYDCAKKEKLER